MRSKILGLVAAGLLLGPMADASSIDAELFDSADFRQNFLMSGETRYTVFQALEDLTIVDLVNDGSAVPNTFSTYTYQLFRTDENWNTPNENNADRIWLAMGMVVDLGDVTPVGVQLEAGGYYRLSIVGPDWIQGIYTRPYVEGAPPPLRVEPFNTTGDLIRVFGAGVNGLGNDLTAITLRVSPVVVPEPGTMLQQLLTDVTGVGPGKSLADKVKLAQTYYAVPDIQATCAVMTDFVLEVKAQAVKKKLTIAQATEFASDANAIMTAIGCN